MKMTFGIGMAVIAVALIFGCTALSLYPSLGSTFDKFWANNNGIYGHILEKDSSSAHYYSVMAFHPTTSTDNGANFPVTVNTFQYGTTGHCGIEQCKDASGNLIPDVYLIKSGWECVGMNNIRFINFPSKPTGVYYSSVLFSLPQESTDATTTYSYAAGGSAYTACHGANVYNIQTNVNFASPTCKDGYCASTETTSSCPEDCLVPTYCGDGACTGTETVINCDIDCSPTFCGDGTCNGQETCATCIGDCGVCPTTCGDNTCNGIETCATCAHDCGACPATCGDGTCNGQETCATCIADCGACPPICGDGTCDDEESVSSCPQDCGEPQNCIDGTPYGSCSTVEVGKKCVDGALVDDSSCSGGLLALLLQYWWAILISVALIAAALISKK